MPDTHCESRAGWFFCWLLNIYDDYLFGVTIRFVRRQSSLAPWAGAAVTSARCQRTGCRQLAETNTEQRSRWQIWVKLSHNNTERKLPFVSNPASYFSRCGSCWCSSDEEEAPGSRQSDELFRIRTVLSLFSSEPRVCLLDLLRFIFTVTHRVNVPIRGVAASRYSPWF